MAFVRVNGSVTYNPSRYEYWFEWEETNINTVDNTSLVTVKTYARRTSTYQSYTTLGTQAITIDGQTFNSSGLTIDLQANQTAQLIRTESKTITHNADGSKSIAISTSGVLGANNPSFSPYQGSASGTITLQTIPREAKVTNSVDFVIEDDIPLTITNSGNFYVKVKLYVNATLIKTVNAGQVTSYNISPSGGEDAAMYAQTPNATSVAMFVRLETYSDSGYTTLVGTAQDKNGTAYVNQTTNAPTFTDYTIANVDKSVVVQDKYSNTLVTSSTDTLLGSTARMIAGYSKVRATITTGNKAVALNSATMSKYRFISGALVSEEVYSGVSTVTVDLDNVLVNSFSVSAIDSRNLSTAVAKTLSVIAEFTPVTIFNVQAVRDNGIDALTKLQFEGVLWNKYFSSNTTSNPGTGVLNTLTCHYRFKETTDTWASQTWESITASVDGSGNITFDDYVDGDLGGSGFDADKSFNIEVRVFDKLSQMLVEITLNVGTPLIDYNREGVAVGGKYDSGQGGKFQVYGETHLNGDTEVAGALTVESLTIDGVDVFSDWKKVSYTFAYVDANTIKITGANHASEFKAGGKLKFTQNSTTKYFNIYKDATFSTDTSIYVNAGTDFAVEDTATYAITNISLSYSDPADFPSIFNFAPALAASGTAFSAGNATVIGHYRQTKKVVEFWIFYKMGNTTSFGTGNYSVSIPIKSKTLSDMKWPITLNIVDSGAKTFKGTYEILNNVSTLSLGTSYFWYSDAATTTGAGTIGATYPMTWATNDELLLYGRYEID